ncbi:MAG TPA: DcaP family trimeric outer membrane transporter [Stellaceae bacterium]|jgi:hypothetical protein|nr:DcaP family trimeric outer membrane transporter [Stellaceae bacterium]
MIRKRNIGTLAALGGITAIAALLTGLPSAKADELSDLRANQDLLQQRIDQLAQIPPGGGISAMGTREVPGANLVGGSFPRSFLIPGTDTSLRVGGQITEIVDYWFTGGPANNSPQTTTVGATGQLESIPLDKHGQVIGGVVQTPATAGSIIDRSRSNGVFSQSPRESKLSVETRTPTAFGEARTLFEFDWAGSDQFVPAANPTAVSDSLVPRLRFAYGTLGGFLAGQANSNFADPDANGETIDFGGNVGEPGHVRIPQVRYTQPLAPYGLLGAISVSAETPETFIETPAGVIASDSPSSALPSGPGLPGALGNVCTGAATVVGTNCSATSPVLAGNPTKASAPDITAAWYVPQPWGHWDLSFVVRPDEEVNDGRFISKQFIGYGAHVGFDVKPGWFGWAKDDFIFQAVGGDALGTYLNASNNFALVTNYLGNGQIISNNNGSTASTTSAAIAGNVIVKPVREYGGEIGYQHWWADNIRSNINAGWQRHDVNVALLGGIASAQAGAINKELATAHANVIWSPVSFVDFGAEYTFGHRLTLNNLRGDEHVLIGEFKVRF